MQWEVEETIVKVQGVLPMFFDNVLIIFYLNLSLDKMIYSLECIYYLYSSAFMIADKT